MENGKETRLTKFFVMKWNDQSNAVERSEKKIESVFRSRGCCLVCILCFLCLIVFIFVGV